MRPHTNRKNLFTATFSHSLWKKKRRKGKPQSHSEHKHDQYSLENSLVPYFQTDKGICHSLSVNILSTVREKIIFFLWHKEIKTDICWWWGLNWSVCVLICVSKGCTHWAMSRKWLESRQKLRMLDGGNSGKACGRDEESPDGVKRERARGDILRSSDGSGGMWQSLFPCVLAQGTKREGL